MWGTSTPSGWLSSVHAPIMSATWPRVRPSNRALGAAVQVDLGSALALATMSGSIAGFDSSRRPECCRGDAEVAASNTRTRGCMELRIVLYRAGGAAASCALRDSTVRAAGTPAVLFYSSRVTPSLVAWGAERGAETGRT